MMSKKSGSNKNSIPVHFADEEADESSAAVDEAERGPETRPDEAADSAAEENLASESGHDTPDDDSTDETSGDDESEETNDSGVAQVTMEGQDFAASMSDPPPADASSLRQTVETAATGPVLAELIATRAELRRVEAERGELREALARRQADFENYRKRVERERSESYNRMVGDVVSKLLPVLDNLRRALEAEGSLEANESEEFRHFLHGVELIYKQLMGVLEGLGLQPVPALGHLFDPHVHEAVVTEHTDEFEPDTVMQEIVPGYRLGEKLLRPAIVKVATR